MRLLWSKGHRTLVRGERAPALIYTRANHADGIPNCRIGWSAAFDCICHVQRVLPPTERQQTLRTMRKESDIERFHGQCPVDGGERVRRRSERHRNVACSKPTGCKIRILNGKAFAGGVGCAPIARLHQAQYLSMRLFGGL